MDAQVVGVDDHFARLAKEEEGDEEEEGPRELAVAAADVTVAAEDEKDPESDF